MGALCELSGCSLGALWELFGSLLQLRLYTTLALTNLDELILYIHSYSQPNFGTVAPLFVIDHSLVPPPTDAQILQEE
jgi:hypothetical protein